MKRHPALIPFSREHQSALILVYRLKHGRSSNPRYPWPTDPVEQRERVLAQFENELNPHFKAEETFFFEPLLDLVGSEARQLIESVLSEHEAMRLSIAEIKRTEENLLDNLKSFGLLLESHIHKEERQLFELLQTEVESSVLYGMLTTLTEQTT